MPRGVKYNKADVDKMLALLREGKSIRYIAREVFNVADS
jgi:hypothetical protein